MVWESGRRCQRAIRDWWRSWKGIKIRATAREDGLTTVKCTWMKPRSGAVASSGIWTRAWVWSLLHVALPMNSCAKMPLPWNQAVTTELVTLHVSMRPPPALKRVWEPLCFFENYINFQGSYNPAAFLGCCLDPELSCSCAIIWTEGPVAFQSWRGWLKFCSCTAGPGKGQARMSWIKYIHADWLGWIDIGVPTENGHIWRQWKKERNIFHGYLLGGSVLWI